MLTVISAKMKWFEQGLPLPPEACDRPIPRSASALRAHTSLREAGRAYFTK
jgi:hypothetical protein